MGSYEKMRDNIKKDEDYVLIPPGVWDVLYELYGGGPPLPRMISPPQNDDRLRVVDELSIEVIPTCLLTSPTKIPHDIDVVTHPWILHCHVSFNHVHWALMCGVSV